MPSIEKAPARKKPKAPRTARGKREAREVLAEASITSQEGLARAHRGGPSRRRPNAAVGEDAGATVRRRARDRRLDSQPSSARSPRTRSSSRPSPDRRDFRQTDTWRVMRIMGEFIEGFDNLAADRQRRHDLRLGAHASRRSAVSGRAGSRAPARRGRLRDHHRRRPRHHGSGEQGRQARRRPLDRLQHRAARSSRAPIRTSIRSSTSATSSCGRRCSSSTRTRSSSSPAASARSTKRSRR